MLMQMGNHFGGRGGNEGGGAASPYLDGVLDSVVMDLDAAQSDSYGGSGPTWANLIASPADGADQTDYDQNRGETSGAEASDPTFSTDKFIMDGGDWFTKASANTALLSGMHKTTGGSAVTFIVNLKTPASLSNAGLISTSGANGTFGITVRVDSSGKIRILHFDGSLNNNDVSSAQLSTSTAHTIAAVIDSTNEVFKVSIDGATYESLSITPTATTAEASEPLTIGAFGSNDIPLNNGYEIYGVHAFNKALSQSELTTALDHIAAR